jgi:hypothetical protein
LRFEAKEERAPFPELVQEASGQRKDAQCHERESYSHADNNGDVSRTVELSERLRSVDNLRKEEGEPTRARASSRGDASSFSAAVEKVDSPPTHS